MRPGQINQNASGTPFRKDFFQNFSQTHMELYNDNSVHCCMYYSSGGICHTSDWERNSPAIETWDGMESMSMLGTDTAMDGGC